MIIDPSDDNFEPTKRYLVVVPGTGYFHVANFDELAADLRPKYAQYLVSTGDDDGGGGSGYLPAIPLYIPSNPAITNLAEPNPDDPQPELDEATAAADAARQGILGELAYAFIEQHSFNQSLNDGSPPTSTASDTEAASAVAAAGPGSFSIEVVNGVDYWPYVFDIPLPKSDASTLVINYLNLETIERQLSDPQGRAELLANNTAPGLTATGSGSNYVGNNTPSNGTGQGGITRFLLVLPIHRADFFFRMLSLAGLVQINDLDKLPPEPK